MGRGLPGDRCALGQRLDGRRAFLNYPAEIRRLVYSRNSIGSYFPNEQAVMKCLYLVVRSLDPTGCRSERWMNRWQPALNAFAITFEGRLFPTDN
jgi:transposase-like protein